MYEYRDNYGKARPADMDLQNRPSVADTAINDFEAYMEYMDAARLKAAIRNFKLVVERYPIHQNPSLKTTLVNYVVAVWRHYVDCGRSPDDLDKVICLSTEARNSWSGEKNIEPYVSLLNTLAGAYFEQYQRAFGPSPIRPHKKQKAFDNAIKYYIELRDNPATGNQQTVLETTLMHCAVAVWRRYVDCGQSPEDLGEVIRLSTKARNSWSGEKNIEPYVSLLNTLAGACFEQYQRAFGPSRINPHEKQKAFDNAIKYYTELKGHATTRGQRSAIQIQLGVMFRMQSILEQTLDRFNIGVQHLQDALMEATEAESEIGVGDKDKDTKEEKKVAVDDIKATCLVNLADFYEVRYKLAGDSRKVHGDLTKAINSNTKAKLILEDLQSPELPACLFNLARQHYFRWLHTGDQSDHDMAKWMAKTAQDIVHADELLKGEINQILNVLEDLVVLEPVV
ncbi:hypothetical protein D9619_010419 [Psilocybe cf. subviscida]|uniref:Uncharacterized protein n=1 Tax=Psilocybe cf. subviscida TaxID=2480587 RepID=A0A8H5ASH6_9AGAR|nr:hypothetical protein D9619_010419 [Psilocybe cf. subviscida]